MTIPPGALVDPSLPVTARRRRHPVSLHDLPWTARDLVRRHRHFFGTSGLVLGGVALGAGLVTTSNGPWIGAALVLLGGILVLEGCVLAFPRPGASP